MEKICLIIVLCIFDYDMVWFCKEGRGNNFVIIWYVGVLCVVLCCFFSKMRFDIIFFNLVDFKSLYRNDLCVFYGKSY